jgi:hypothetical protein
MHKKCHQQILEEGREEDRQKVEEFLLLSLPYGTIPLV